MKYYADLHIHSRYSRATSRDMSPESLWKWAQLKGITVVGAGDFTHPEWLSELRSKLEQEDNGLYSLKKEMTRDAVPESCRSEVFFMLSAEISCIYRKKDKTRKVHCIVYAPDFADASKINKALSRIGNLSADGRPILGLDARELLSIVLEKSPASLLVPAHVWTPHFSVFGAASGFDSLEECFEDLTPHICAIETGLSSDPSMNWRISALDHITLVSNSDAHSPSKLGREANIFDTDISYPGIVNALKTKQGFRGTIEFFPEEGKYHYDGHRSCHVCLSPPETLKHNYLCPVCGKRLTIGVMHRVEKLADRESGFTPAGASAYLSIIPLAEIISETLGVGVNSKSVGKVYSALLDEVGNEFHVLLDAPLKTIESAGTGRLSEAISKVRSGNVHIAPGCDGEYGRVRIFEKVEHQKAKGQKRLF